MAVPVVYLKPNNLIQADAGWAFVGAASFHEAIDDGILSGTPDDATSYVTCATGGARLAFRLEDPTGFPINHAQDHVIRIRCRNSGGDLAKTLKVGLAYGTNIIVYDANVLPTSSFQTFVVVIPAGQIALIPQPPTGTYNQLNGFVIMPANAGAAVMEVTAYELEIPDPDMRKVTALGTEVAADATNLRVPTYVTSQGSTVAADGTNLRITTQATLQAATVAAELLLGHLTRITVEIAAKAAHPYITRITSEVAGSALLMRLGQVSAEVAGQLVHPAVSVLSAEVAGSGLSFSPIITTRIISEVAQRRVLPSVSAFWAEVAGRVVGAVTTKLSVSVAARSWHPLVTSLVAEVAGRHETRITSVGATVASRNALRLSRLITEVAASAQRIGASKLSAEVAALAPAVDTQLTQMAAVVGASALRLYLSRIAVEIAGAIVLPALSKLSAEVAARSTVLRLTSHGAEVAGDATDLRVPTQLSRALVEVAASAQRIGTSKLSAEVGAFRVLQDIRSTSLIAEVAGKLVIQATLFAVEVAASLLVMQITALASTVAGRMLYFHATRFTATVAAALAFMTVTSLAGQVAGNSLPLRTSTLAAEIASDGTDRTQLSRLTLLATEVAGKALTLRITSQGGTVGGKRGSEPRQVTKLSAEIAAVHDLTVQVTSTAAELAGKINGMRVTRLFTEVAQRRILVRLTHIGGQVAGAIPPTLPFDNRITKLAAEFAGKVSTGQSFITKQTAEVASYLPITKGEVVPLSLPARPPRLLRINWTVAVELETSYLTDVAQSGTTLAEDRRGLLERPFRTITVQFTGMTRDESAEVLMTLNRHAEERLPVPIYCDHSKILSVVNGTFLQCDVTRRRFFRGQRIALHKWTRTGRPVNTEFALIKSLSGNGIHITAPLSGSFVAGDRIFPMMDCELLPNSTGSWTDDAGFAVRFTAREKIGKSALPPIIRGYETLGLATYQARPMLQLEPSSYWGGLVGTGVLRAGREFEAGRSTVLEVAGERPLMSGSVEITALSRRDIWRALQLFDYAKGRSNTFWAMGGYGLLDPVALGANYIDVLPAGDPVDLDNYVDHVSLYLRNSAVITYPLTSVQDNGATWRVFVSGQPSAIGALDQIRRVTTASLVRLTSDSLVERWSSNETGRVQMEMIDVLREDDVEVLGLDDGSDLFNPTSVENLHFWFEAQRHTLHDAADHADPAVVRGLSATKGQTISVWDDMRLSPSAPFMSSNTQDAQRTKLASFVSPNFNGNKPAVRFMRNLTSDQSQFLLRDGTVDLLSNPFWDNVAGMTLIISLRGTAGAGDVRTFINRPGVLVWDGTGVTMFETLGGGPVVRTHSGMNFTKASTLVLKWAPGSNLTVWLDGVSKTTGATVLDLDNTRLQTLMLQLRGNLDAGLSDDAAIGLQPFVSAFLCYKRALPNNEINALAHYLDAIYGTKWTNLV